MFMTVRACAAATVFYAVSLAVGVEEVREMPKASMTEPISKGQRVFSCGHSFHYFVPAILEDMARSAGLTGHVCVGLSAIGGSQVLMHWNVPDAQNKAKEALRKGEVDVLTLSPLYPPDEGIEKFAILGLEHNPAIRITVEEIWLRWDVYEPSSPDLAPVYLPGDNKKLPATVDHNALTGPELRKRHAPLFESMDAYVRDLNKKLGKPVLFVVPAGQAVVAMREKVIAGQAPGLKTQEDLFADPVGHPTAPLQALVAYCHFAVIYRRSPVGLPMPAVLKAANNPKWDDKLNRVLQEVAWDAVTHHPLSGVTAAATSGR